MMPTVALAFYAPDLPPHPLFHEAHAGGRPPSPPRCEAHAPGQLNFGHHASEQYSTPLPTNTPSPHPARL